MEDAAEALKMAFAVFVLIIGLGLAIHMFSETRQTVDVILQTTDETTYYSYETANSETSEYRIVGLETIIPTMYKYNKENYIIKFEGVGNLYTSPKTGSHKEIDLNAEIERGELWTGAGGPKIFIDNLVYGTEDPSNPVKVKYVEGQRGILEKWSGYKFEERIGRVEDADEDNHNKTTSQKVITYIKIN